MRAEAEGRKQLTLDATCPLVTKVHNEARRFHRDGYHILLVGHEGHEEVEGTAGEAPEVTHLVDGVEGVAKLPDFLQEEKLIWLSQTTLSVDETITIVNQLRERFPHLENPPSDDICYATQNRQESVKNIAPKCDLMIVVGSKNSSNSVRLVEVALEAGSKTSYLVDFASEIDEAWLEGVETVGVTCGASVPELLVREVLEFLDERGYSTSSRLRRPRRPFSSPCRVSCAQHVLHKALRLKAGNLDTALAGAERPDFHLQSRRESGLSLSLASRQNLVLVEVLVERRSWLGLGLFSRLLVDVAARRSGSGRRGAKSESSYSAELTLAARSRASRSTACWRRRSSRSISRRRPVRRRAVSFAFLSRAMSSATESRSSRLRLSAFC